MFTLSETLLLVVVKMANQIVVFLSVNICVNEVWSRTSKNQFSKSHIFHIKIIKYCREMLVNVCLHYILSIYGEIISKTSKF